MKNRIILVYLLIVFGLLLASAVAGPVPDTGQSISYTGTFGEDSDYSINPPSYTKLGENGVELPDTATQAEGWIMTRDNVTGLVWEIKTDDDSIHDKDNEYTWYDPNPETNGGDAGTPGDGTDTQDFTDALNDSEFGGFSDWRMPTRMELRSIVDYGAYILAIDTAYFPNTLTSFYWSSTTYAKPTGEAWSMWFYCGIDNSTHKSGSNYVRAVRGEPLKPLSAPFIDNGDGTITDTATGFMWQKEDDNTTRTWESAISYCDELLLSDYGDEI